MPSSFNTTRDLFHRLDMVDGDYILTIRGSRPNGAFDETSYHYTPEDLGKLKDLLLGVFKSDTARDIGKLEAAALDSGYVEADDITIINTTKGKAYFTTKNPVRLFSPKTIQGMLKEDDYVYLKSYRKKPGMPKLWLEFDPLAWLDANFTPQELNVELKKLNLV